MNVVVGEELSTNVCSTLPLLGNRMIKTSAVDKEARSIISGIRSRIDMKQERKRIKHRKRVRFYARVAVLMSFAIITTVLCMYLGAVPLILVITVVALGSQGLDFTAAGMGIGISFIVAIALVIVSICVHANILMAMRLCKCKEC